MKRVLFLGQKPMGEACFGILLKQKGLTVCAAVSNENVDTWWKSKGVWELALNNEIPFISNDKPREQELLKIIKEQKVDAIVSVQHNWIISDKILKAVSGFALNLHNAKLPEYKGYNTYNHAILNGDETYTCTVHWMDPEVDAGDIALESTFTIARTDTACSLFSKAESAGIKLFATLIEYMASDNKIPRIKQVGQGRFYGRDSLDKLRQIKDPSDMNDMALRSRAFHFPPFEPAYFIHEGLKHHVTPILKEQDEDCHER